MRKKSKDSRSPRELIIGLCKKVSQRVLDVMPEPGVDGYFSDFGEYSFLPDCEYGKATSVFIQRDEKRPGKAFLGLSVLHPNELIDASVYMTHGTKYELSEYLASCDIDEFMIEYNRLTESLKKA